MHLKTRPLEALHGLITPYMDQLGHKEAPKILIISFLLDQGTIAVSIHFLSAASATYSFPLLASSGAGSPECMVAVPNGLSE